MNPLEPSADHGADAEQAGTLRSPVTRTARFVILTGDHDQRYSLRSVPLGGVVDSHAFAAGLVTRHAAFDARHHEVADADVGECSPHHDVVVAATRAVAIEVAGGNAAIP